MALSEARKRANKKWDADNMRNLSIKLRKEYAEEVKRACQEAGTTPAAVMRAAIDRFMHGEPVQEPVQEPVHKNDSDIPVTQQALNQAKRAAEKAGEELGVFLARAIREAADRDELVREQMARREAEAKKAEQLKQKEEAPAFNGDFYARHQEYKKGGSK